MELMQHSDGQTLSITIQGRLDTMTAPQLETMLEEVLQEETTVCLDMLQLAYISSAGLRVLLSLGKTLMKRNGILQLQHVNEEVYEVFEITGITDLFEIIET